MDVVGVLIVVVLVGGMIRAGWWMAMNRYDWEAEARRDYVERRRKGGRSGR